MKNNFKELFGFSLVFYFIAGFFSWLLIAKFTIFIYESFN
jgi:hypothetical protein